MLYRVTGALTATCHTLVEAGSPEEAKRLAERRGVAEIRNVDGDANRRWVVENDGWAESLVAVSEEQEASCSRTAP